jgi:hypothetical protein
MSSAFSSHGLWRGQRVRRQGFGCFGVKRAAPESRVVREDITGRPDPDLLPLAYDSKPKKRLLHPRHKARSNATKGKRP